ncbi:hypothetical protein INS49_010566 [Diaporthe citri]|uniref:uncharacterized protein n=1 Tax=Diaporthe citri TaxID=83186 RepID=UPI001C7EF0CE|nr:uncharacterized protein INS49_010566 [Diaporthe citri]KAG6362336.1 hypothetical protein INS49_010566 [Diaporthe citri]
MGDGQADNTSTMSLSTDTVPAQETSISCDPNETSSSGTAQVITAPQRLKVGESMTAHEASGKGAKDMAAYKFWSTQPVMRFDEEAKQVEDGPLQHLKLHDNADVEDVCELMNRHYVEDADEMFRFNYGTGILKCPASSSPSSRPFPVQLRVRGNVLDAAEVNFICVHKKLRSKRLAPVLIKEITRLCNRERVWQAICTASVVLPKPVSTCRCYHRALNWQKLYEVGFSHLPAGSKPQHQAHKYALTGQTSIKGWREMQARDVDAVHQLLSRLLERYDIAPVYSREEIRHWFVPELAEGDDQVVWAYVVEDGGGRITDFVSFFSLESSIIGNPKHKALRVAYLFYYASEGGLTAPADRPAYKTRLNQLIGDALTVAKRAKFDVFNALSLMDNALFLEQQKFGPGDGLSHYYLFNYRVGPVRGGIDKENQLDEQRLNGVGFVNL